MKGLIIQIFDHRDPDSISFYRGVQQLTIIDPRLPAIFEPSESAPPALLYQHYNDWVIIPIDGGHGMFSGRFGYTSDSRWCRLFPSPLRLHDRRES